MKKIKVLVVDDSAVVRQVVASMLAEDPEIEVMAAPDPRLTLVQVGEGANAFELQCSMPFAPPTTHSERDEQSALGRST